MYVIATVICPNFHFSVSPHVPFLNLLFEQIAIPTRIYLQKSASIQPRTSPSKFGGKIQFNIHFTPYGAPFRHGSAGMEVCHLPRTTEVNPSAHAWRISWSSNFIEPASLGDLRANIVGGGFVGRSLLDLRVLDFQRPAEGLPLRIRFQLYQVKPSVVRFSRRRKPRNPFATKCT